MTSPTVSPQLLEWSRLAGYALTPEDESGAALFWSDPGGEIRYYIHQNIDGGVVLTSSERASAEQFELSAESIEVLERYLFGVFGRSIRSKSRLPRLKTPRKLEEIVGGDRIDEADSEGYRRLLAPGAKAVAKARGRLSGVSVLVELSHLVASTVDEIQSSYQAVDGRPLFRI